MYSRHLHRVCPKHPFSVVFATRGLASTTGPAASVSATKFRNELKPSYDVVIIGAGHNALVSAAYLQQAGRSVCVLEKRPVIGGAAVTEEIVPGFKFSRASYLASLLRPYIISDLKLKEFGLKFYLRMPYNSYTPIAESRWPEFKSKSLLLSSNQELSRQEIAKFSQKDATAYVAYEKQMEKFVHAITHLIDTRPVNINQGKSLFSLKRLRELKPILKAVRSLGIENVAEFHEMMTAPASKILNKWFESEPLKASLATDALIGTYSGPHTPGTGYVLLHHIMGGVDGKAGAWAYVEGGMGAVSEAMGKSAATLGAHIFTDTEVSQIVVTNSPDGGMKSTGVVLADGTEVKAKTAVMSGATPHVTFRKLLAMDTSPDVRKHLGDEFVQAIQNIDYTSPVTKINVALNKIPNFAANPNASPNMVHDWHKCTIHINCETMQDLQNSYESSKRTNTPSQRPLIEMVIPSSLDPTLTPTKDSHVCLLFTQYTPFAPSNGTWSNYDFKEKYAENVFNTIEEYAPGFKESIVDKEVLTPWDLEQTFGLTGGNIFHGSMSVDQLYWIRPIRTKRCWFPETPIKGLYLCGSGCHPGGGVMGVPGYLAAKALLKIFSN